MKKTIALRNHGRHFGDKLSPENQGVFQLLKEVIFRRILAFYNSRKWALLVVLETQVDALWLAGGSGPRYFGEGERRDFLSSRIR